MDTREMKSLEDKTRAIVETLSNLEGETRRQKRMGDQLEQSRNSIQKLTSELTTVAAMLSEAVQLLQNSTLAHDIDRLDERIDEVKGLADTVSDSAAKVEKICTGTAKLALKVKSSLEQVSDRLDALEGTCSSLAEGVSALREEYERHNGELERRMDELSEVIGRIDRNTQKGFGKERG